jgi:23S rRNA (cytidine2498-2'-O)-methyltransferase
MNLTNFAGRVYQAVPEFEDHLRRELGTWDAVRGPLYFAKTPPDPVFWYRNIWLDPRRIEFDSISAAAAALRSMQRNWTPVLCTQFRRGALINAKLPPISAKPRPFPWPAPETPAGAWTLLDAHTLVASPRCASPFPGGVIEFAEDREGPPSRAYLKLWEALARCRRWPGPGDRCLDAGASPGGWTWALARLGANVTAVDRAPLDPGVVTVGNTVMEDAVTEHAAPGTGLLAEGGAPEGIAPAAGVRPAVEFIRHDAFTLKPEDLGPMDWVFSDVICYPSRLYGWVEKWLASGLCENFVCTIKMQGDKPDMEMVRRFAAIPGGTVVHLYHNKHELTWMKIKETT